MRSSGKSTLALGALLPVVLVALFAVPAGAQAADASAPARGPVPMYNNAHEITINGSVQQVVTKREIGSPAGMHLIVSGATGTVDAHIGPYLTKSMKSAMHTGLPLEVVGTMITIRGKQMLLARQLKYGGQTLYVRSKGGTLLMPALFDNSPALRNNPWLTMNGGVR
jgi:hypothetical protein